MRLHWFGHAAFLIESADGRRLMLDPYEASAYGESFRYKPIEERADLVLVTHSHKDHDGAATIAGAPPVLDKPGTYESAGFAAVGIETAHDAHEGAERGPNVVWRFTVDGLACAHMGDLGHRLTNAQVGAIGPVDVLMLPVGGHFTIDARMAREVVRRIARHVVIPMHYKTDRCDFPIADVEPFIEAGTGPVVRVQKPDLVLNPGDLPPVPTIYVLEPSN